MKFFIQKKPLVGLLAFFILVLNRGGHLKKNTLYDPPNVLSDAIHWLFPLILGGECFWLIGNGWWSDLSG